jgi:hypothetical protein
MSQIFQQLAVRCFAVRCVLVASYFLALVAELDAAPKIQSLSVRGLQVGGTTTVRVTGTDLLPNPRLLLSVPIAQQTVKPNATATQVEFDVTLDGRVSPGIYNLWVVSDSGASPTAIVAADHLPNLAFGPEVPSLPASLHGVVSGSQKLRTVFSVSKGQAVLLEVESQRLGGKLRPVLHIYDSENRHLQWSLPSSVLRGDTRLQFNAPADGKYTVELHDLQYAAPAPNYFRLKIGAWQYADLAFPPAVERANPGQVELIGNLAVGNKVAVVPNRSPEAPPVMTNVAAGAFRPSVLISDNAELTEAAPAEGLQQLPAVPFGISGRLLSEGEQDKYKLTVTSGTKLRFKVFADQLGAPMDAVLQILNEQGGQLAVSDDVAASADPSLDYVIPADTTTVVLAIKETNGIGNPNNVYRIHVSDVTNEASTSDYQLKIAEQEQSVTAGERLVVKVTVERVNYAGPIRLEFDTLPDGVQTQGAMIAADADSTLLTLHGAGLATSHALTSLRGVAEIADREVVRYVNGATHPLSSMQPWIGRELAMALAAPSEIDFDFGWGQIGAETQLALGGKLEVPLQFFRPAGFDGPVRVTAEFSQKPVLVNGNVDTNRTMRSETNQPVEMAVVATAQQAWDAKLVADKSLATTTTAQATVAQTAVRATADAEAILKTAVAQLTAAMEVAKAAETQAKATVDAVAAASEVLAKVVAKVQSVATGNNTAAGDAAGKSAEAVAAAAAEFQTAAAELQAAAIAKANAQKAAISAEAKVKEAGIAVTAAQATATQADVAAKSAQAAELKAKADAETAVKAAMAQQTAAAVAADNAARLAKNDGAFAIFVPAELSQPGYEVAFKAELLTRDKTKVLATRYSEVRRLPTLNPIVLEHSTPGQIAAVIDAQAGATVAVSGKVNRLAGMDQDVTVSLVGLPAGIAVPTASVKADQTDYTLEVKFPATFKPAELTGVRVFATGNMRVNAPIAVRSQELPVAIQLTAPPVPVEKK